MSEMNSYETAPEHWLLPDEQMPRTPAFTRGNEVAALVDGQAYMADLKTTLAACVRQLLIAGWLFDGEQRLDPAMKDGALAGETLVEAVTGVARRGADVRALIFDAPTTSLPVHFRQNQAAANRHFAEAVNGAGGDSMLDGRLALAEVVSSHHQKFIVATSSRPDATVAWVGGIDLAIDRWDTPGHDSPPERQADRVAGWHDVQARIQGPAIAQVWSAFRARWNDERRANRHPTLHAFHGKSRMQGEPPAVAPAGRKAVQLRQTLPVGVYPETGGPGEDTIAKGHIRAIERARHFIYIEDQYVWPCALVDPLVDALERGVHVVMVVAKEDFGLALRATSSRLRRQVLDRLERAGQDRLHVFHLEQPKGENAQIYVHAKVMIVDDCYVSIGSANFNSRSLANDTEMEVAVVDEELVATTIAGEPVRVCRFAHELRVRLWAEHFERAPDKLRDPIASLPLLWPQENEPHRRAQPHHVTIGPLLLDPIIEHITTLVTEGLAKVPFLKIPDGDNDRATVKLIVSAALRGPSRALLLHLFEQSINPTGARTANLIVKPVTSAWRRLWARRAAHAADLVGKRSLVNETDVAGQEFVETLNGVHIFRLADGRYHVVSHFAVPSLETARAAAIAVSGEMD
jgi:phosphatidylserine/phosphatidylglycerophosphate/cardiolipin synthase-like enzyme